MALCLTILTSKKQLYSEVGTGVSLLTRMFQEPGVGTYSGLPAITVLCETNEDKEGPPA